MVNQIVVALETLAKSRMLLISLTAMESDVSKSLAVRPGVRATSRYHRGFSKKLQGMMKQQRPAGEEGKEEGKKASRGERFEARNWKQISDKKLAKLTTVERSRYMAVS